MNPDEQGDAGEFGSDLETPGQVPDQGGSPARESLSGRVPGQAPAGQGGVAPEAFIGEEFPVRAVVPSPPTRSTANARPPTRS
ncbi:hypothetical protein ACFQ2M_23930 [Kitasatospora saccharophila]|uniref:hypothetical protein n=1 Tax=Kitasatospora saccharophila TaxID=407973 RepID=UPI0036252AAA